ncbi:MAG: protease modulator HflC, partial [Thermotogae bacterium]
MKLAILITVAVVVVIAAVFAVSSLFIVDQTDQAVLLRFGEIRKIITEPGLYFRTPFIDNVHRFEKRIMIYDIAVEKIITADKKTLLIDTYVLWKIYDAKKFIESIKN